MVELNIYPNLLGTEINLLHYLKTSPAAIQLGVMMYVRLQRDSAWVPFIYMQLCETMADPLGDAGNQEIAHDVIDDGVCWRHCLLE